MDQPKIYIVYHCHLINNYESTIDNQLNKMFSSGLLDSTKKIYLSLCGPSENVAIAKSIFNGDDRFDVIHESTENLEHPSIERVKDLGDADANILYMHTKGVSHPGNINVQDWRHMLDYFCVEKWEDAQVVLNKYDTYGADWTGDRYEGNFWWATSKYIEKLPKPIEGQSVQWLGKTDGRHYSAHESKTDHYHQPYPRILYY